ncbi:MAG: phosphatidate cytidylyltransferase [Rhodobacteraceae bacterium]|nr:phosphatidate cytidylyltransferase [Paracoccaceae bacterium]
MNAPRNWDDLRPRLITGGVLVAIGVTVIWLGGTVFAVTAALVTGIMVWELARMIAQDRAAQAMQLGVLAGTCLLLARHLDPIFAGPLLLAPAAAGAVLLRAHTGIFAAYALGITIAGFGLTLFRDSYGMVWLFWLMLVVAGTDIAGYFGGRLIGGPKFWPAISPKKTWAGIVCGWIAAALIGLIFLTITDSGRDLIWISSVLSFASQMGDIAESAVKRRMGVKDSSNLLPGHGGLFDRFDALLGASLFMLLVALLVDVPELRF